MSRFCLGQNLQDWWALFNDINIYIHIYIYDICSQLNEIKDNRYSHMFQQVHSFIGRHWKMIYLWWMIWVFLSQQSWRLQACFHNFKTHVQLLTRCRSSKPSHWNTQNRHHNARSWDKVSYVFLSSILLTHRDRVTHICASKLNIIGSDNGLSPGRRQAIIWTNAEIF